MVIRPSMPILSGLFTSQLVLRLLCWYFAFSASVGMCVCTYNACTIITSRSLHCCHATLLSRLWQFRRLLCVATMSLAQLRVRDGYRQGQRRRDGARLTESGNARSERLLVVPTESLTNRQLLLGELLSGSERRRPGWF